LLARVVPQEPHTYESLPLPVIAGPVDWLTITFFFPSAGLGITLPTFKGMLRKIFGCQIKDESLSEYEGDISEQGR